LDTTTTSILVFACVFGAAIAGMLLRRAIPDDHLASDTKDSVKVAMALIATMSALILGLLVAAAKDTFDNEAAGVTQMAAKVMFLDRVLANYGSETKDVRELLRHDVERIVNRMWPQKLSEQVTLDPGASRAETMYVAIHQLSPQSDLQTALKSQALSTALEIGQLRWLEFEQAASSISTPLLCILTFWLAVLFISFGLFSPRNATVIVALLLAALSVSGAIYLMIELNSPFTGILQVSRAPFDGALAHLGK
jgi:hypothetical protein